MRPEAYTEALRPHLPALFVRRFATCSFCRWRRDALAFVLALATFFLAPTALAQGSDVSDFEAARSAYNAGDFALAVERLEAMVGGEMPSIENEVLILESRKYLAAAYLFEQRTEDAERQFALLLAQEPGYALDPLAFPAAVQETFQRVRERVRNELEAREAARQEAERQRRDRMMQRLLAEQERIARLEAFATEIENVQTNSRWLAALPFGVGQFQNGHRGFGIALLTTEIFLATTSIATFVYHRYLAGQVDNMGIDAGALENTANTIERLNQVSTGLLAAVMLGGIIDAQVRFVPTVRTTRRRELPEELRNIGQELQSDAGPSFRLRLGVGYAGLHINF